MTDQPLNTAKDGVVLQITEFGNSTGVILPEEVLPRLRPKAVDVLHLVETSEREIRLSRDDPKHAKAMEIAREVFADYTDTFKALAK